MEFIKFPFEVESLITHMIDRKFLFMVKQEKSDDSNYYNQFKWKKITWHSPPGEINSFWKFCHTLCHLSIPGTNFRERD